jgi:hypothetical protein
MGCWNGFPFRSQSKKWPRGQRVLERNSRDHYQKGAQHPGEAVNSDGCGEPHVELGFCRHHYNSDYAKRPQSKPQIT